MTSKLMLGSLLLVAAAACGSSSSGGTPKPQGSPQHPASLVGVVGKNDAFSISLADDQGNAISNLAAGTYKLLVHDDSGIHNFHLFGSGVAASTPVPQAVTKTFTVTFKPGTYSFQCDSHVPQMHGSFTVS